jgi:beta-phosphoglucomutase-like phosphatase (HAD superfamily)
MDQKRGLIIYDFDDVIANSEVLANAELAEIVTELGVATTLEEAYRLYMGKRFADVIPAIEASVGNPCPMDLPPPIRRSRWRGSGGTCAPFVGAREHISAFPTLRSESLGRDRPTGCLYAWS